MKNIGSTPFTTRLRCIAAPLLAIALPACLPSLEMAPDVMQDVTELGREPQGAAGSSGQGQPPHEPEGAAPDAEPPAGEPPSPSSPAPPLQLQGVTPGALIDVPVDAPLRISFAEALDAAASSFTLQLLRDGAVPVAGESVLEENGIAFRPAQGLALGNSYTLLLEGTVRSASGAQWTGREEASFRTREGSWLAPLRLAAAGDSPRIAVDAVGNALVIWNEPDSSLSGQARLGLSQYTLSGGWQALPPTMSCGPVCQPKFVAGGGDGVFQFAWASEGSLRWQLYHRDAGFEAPESVPGRGTPSAVGAIVEGQPWMAMNLPQGISVSFGGSAGNAPSPSVTDAGLVRAGPVLVVDRSQTARVFWGEGTNLLQLGPGASARPVVMASWAGNEEIAGITGASVPSGDAIVAWETLYRSMTDGSVLFSSLGVLLVGPDGVALDGDGPPLPAAADGNRSRPAASLNDEGHALLGWLRSDGDPSDPLAVHVWLAYRSGTSRTWSEAVPLSLERTGSAHPPAVGLDSSGNGHGIWVETDEAGDAQLYGARLRAGNLSGLRFPISRDAPVLPAATRNPLSGDDNTRLVVDRAGRALALWVSATGELWSARFE